MKVGTLRFVVVAVITGLLTVAGSTAAWGSEACPASPNYSSDFSANQQCLTRNPSSGTTPQFVQVGNQYVLRLTTNAPNQTGSVWFNTQQPVQNGFSTTFQFQFTNPSSTTPADGIAFVIQNSSVNAIGFTGGNGGALGYGDQDSSADNTTGEGIPNSLAIEFDTYQNSRWDSTIPHVAVQSCGVGKNTSHHGQVCTNSLDPSTLGGPVSVPNLLDGKVHKATISYVPPPVGCEGTSCNSLHIIIDDTDILPAGIKVNLANLLDLSNGNAYIGFTGATGGQNETQDILTWTFTPQSQSTVVTTGQQTTIPFQDGAYNYTAQLNSGGPTTAQVTPIILNSSDCDNLIHRNGGFVGAHCFVYKNALGSGMDSPVLFELTCPQLSTSGVCFPLDAELGTQFNLSDLNIGLGFDPNNPYPGWLKGEGDVTGSPCAINDPVAPLFASNQISSFDPSQTPDPFTKGKSGGTGSCWVATFNTPDEAPTVTIAAPVNNGVYQQNQNDATTNTSFTCTTEDHTPNSTGPYLTRTSCTATQTPGGSVANGVHFDTATLGTHTFTATVVDSGTDHATATSTYTVVGATDLAILNLAALRAKAGSTLTYAIGVGDLGGASAVGVTVTDTLPAGLAPQSGSGNNVSCSVVNRRLTCTTTQFSCGVSGQTVSCSLGPISPLSLSSLNGATLQIKATVTATAGTVLKNTASVGSANADSKPSNNSSTASTLVTK